MHRNNIFGGVSGGFWSLTFLLVAGSIVVASVGGYDLSRAFLAVMAVYSILGIVYGAWAARNAVMRQKAGRS
jgi:hypothetical protein